MKSLLTLLFIFFSTHLVAQEWRLAVLNDTVYYKVDMNNLNQYNNYMRVVFFDSTKTINNDTVSYYFHSFLKDTIMPVSVLLEQCMDSLGTCWQGKFHVKKPNNDEFLVNSFDSLLLFKPQSPLGTSWTITHDTAGIQYKASITGYGMGLADGVTDSIKVITITTYLNGVPVNNFYNNKQIKISKNHGWLSCFEWHSFPYRKFTNKLEQYPEIKGLHKRIDRSVVSTKMWNFDPLKVFIPGFEWIRHNKYAVSYSFYNYYYHDSVKSYVPFNADSGVVTIHRKFFNRETHTGPISSDTFYCGSAVLIDTVYAKFNNKSIRDSIYPEAITRPINTYDAWTPYFIDKAHFGYSYYLDTFCTNSNQLSLISNSMGALKQTSACLVHDYFEDHGTRTYFFHDKAVIPEFDHIIIDPIGPYFTYYLDTIIYLKTDSCVLGSFINLCALGLKDEPYSYGIKLIPNPARNTFYIKEEKASNVPYNISIYDMVGHKLKTLQSVSQQAIEISDLSPGMYVILIEKENKSARLKLLKE